LNFQQFVLFVVTSVSNLTGIAKISIVVLGPFVFFIVLLRKMTPHYLNLQWDPLKKQSLFTQSTNVFDSECHSKIVV